MKKIIKCAIFYANLDPVIGSEQNGIRPVLILQNELGNMHSPTVIIAPITSKKENKLPTHVDLKTLNIIRPNSIVLLEQIRTIDKSRLKGFVCNLCKKDMKKVEKAILISFDIKSDLNNVIE